jgi:hypothetical protein
MTRCHLDKQVRRMLLSPKAHALVETFAEQWLGCAASTPMNRTDRNSPSTTRPLRKAMYDETTMFFESVMREDRSILDLLDSDYTFLNERLAKHYGISDVTGPQMRRVKLTDRNRGGVLSMAGILTITSGPTRTSPVRRGQWILEEILGDPPPPPPPGSPSCRQGKGSRRRPQPPPADGAPSLLIRAAHPAISAWTRSASASRISTPSDAGAPMTARQAIDASGTMPGGKTFKGPIELKTLLPQPTRKPSPGPSAEKMLIFALGRSLKDLTTTRSISSPRRSTAKDQYRFSSVVTQHRRQLPLPQSPQQMTPFRGLRSWPDRG